MQIITLSGNIGRDAELRSTQGGDEVCSFNVAVKQGFGRDASSQWFRCSLWGKRARSLHPYLIKGVKCVVTGDLTIGEYQGKPQYEVRVGDVEMMSRGEGGRPSDRSQGHAPSPADLDDDVPF